MEVSQLSSKLLGIVSILGHSRSFLLQGDGQLVEQHDTLARQGYGTLRPPSDPWWATIPTTGVHRASEGKQVEISS